MLVMKFLIVDDLPLFNKKLIENLGDDYKIHVATNGKQGLDEFYRSHKINEPFDIIFLDLNMPMMRGESMLLSIRAYEDSMQLDNVKVIIISAEQHIDKVMELFKIGCDYYIKQPVLENDINKALTFIYQYER
jgi:DNA-binding response OmpR family regulator